MFLVPPLIENPTGAGFFNASCKETLFLPKGPCGKKMPPGGFPERLVSVENLFMDFFLNVAKDIYHTKIFNAYNVCKKLIAEK